MIPNLIIVDDTYTEGKATFTQTAVFLHTKDVEKFVGYVDTSAVYPEGVFPIFIWRHEYGVEGMWEVACTRTLEEFYEAKAQADREQEAVDRDKGEGA